MPVLLIAAGSLLIGTSGTALGYGIYRGSKYFYEHYWRDWCKWSAMTEAQRNELIRFMELRQQREMERASSLDEMVAETRRERRHLQEDTETSLAKMSRAAETIRSDASIIDSETSRLRQIDEALKQSTLKHDTIIHKIQTDFQGKMDQLEKASNELMRSKEKELLESHAELISTAKELDLTKTKLGQVVDESLQKDQQIIFLNKEISKLRTQIEAYKRALAKSKTESKALVKNIASSNQLLEQLSQQLEKMRDLRTPSSDPRLFRE